MKNNQLHYEKYAKQILKMPIREAERTLSCFRKHNGDEETDKIVSQFSKVLGGAI